MVEWAMVAEAWAPGSCLTVPCIVRPACGCLPETIATVAIAQLGYARNRQCGAAFAVFGEYQVSISAEGRYSDVTRAYKGFLVYTKAMYMRVEVEKTMMTALRRMGRSESSKVNEKMSA